MDALPIEYSPATAVQERETHQTWTRHILWFALPVFLALVARLPFYWSSPYPLNDGGMFAQIVDDLRANHFALPRYTTYNFENIPLCYPPIGFYLGAIWATLFHQTSLDALRWVPLAFNLLSLPVLYLIGLEFFESAWLASAATCIYAVVPRGWEWLVMGGGLTRSPGEFLALVAILLFLKATKQHRRGLAVWAGIAVGLSLLTHLEAGLFAAVSLVVLAFVFMPVRNGLPLLLISGAVSTAVFVPWLLWAMARSGPGPFAAAFLTHGADGSSTTLLTAGTALPWLFLAVVMALFRQPAWAVWILAIYLLIPRSAETHVAIVLSLFGAWLLSKVAEWLKSSPRVPHRLGFARTSPGATLLALCGLLCLAFSLRFVHRHHNTGDRLHDLYLDYRATLAPGDVQAMYWIRSHLPENAKFLVFDERSGFWSRDLVAEWFPYLAQRESVLTAQGREWLPHNAFARTVKTMVPNQQGCSLHSIEKIARTNSFQYLFISGPLDEDYLGCEADMERTMHMTKVAYQNQNVTILTRPEATAR